ncbi:hypothetical protein [Rhizobium binae]|nr:hypothetical protein [Rhizobium binae]
MTAMEIVATATKMLDAATSHPIIRSTLLKRLSTWSFLPSQ